MSYDYLYKTSIKDRIKLEANTWESVAKEIVCVSPIKTRDIPHFSEWINFNGFAHDHFGKDFAVYLNKWGESVLGLPGNTNVHSILDGVILHINKTKIMEGVINPYDDYLENIIIGHGVSAETQLPTIMSFYAHTKSKVKVGEFVKMGQKIGQLHMDKNKWNKGRLVHLHFGLANYNGRILNYENPDLLFNDMMNLTAQPQRETSFTIEETNQKAKVRLANFKTLNFQSGENKQQAPHRLIEYMLEGRKKGLQLPKPNDFFSAPKPTYRYTERAKELLNIRY